MEAEKSLQQLRQKLANENAEAITSESINRVNYHSSCDGLHVFYFGDYYSEAFEEFSKTISVKKVAEVIASVTIDGPDEGANGTKNWDLTTLLSGPTDFPKLKEFHVTRTRPEHHNRTIIASIYKEDGQIGELVKKTPNIEMLTVPSAPSSNFYQNLPALRYLDVDAGYDTQEFISKLADIRDPFPLRFLGWGDYCETYIEEWEAQTTSFSCMEKLFCSPVMNTLSMLHLRNPFLTDGQLKTLAQKKPDLQILVIRENSQYIQV